VFVLGKVLVVYESKWGNTKMVAETIAEGITKAPGVETTINSLKDVKTQRLTEFDAILIGSPNHMGKATGGIRRFINQLSKLQLEGKYIAFFDTYLGGDYEKAVKKMERQATDKLSGLELVVPSLSIRVKGMQGPIADGELPKCKEFGANLITKLSTRV
jgi:flavorubredoxin